MGKPSPGAVIATMAVVLALGGTAVAVDSDPTAKVQTHKLEFKNGWRKYGGDSLFPRYFVVGDVVHLEGALYGGTPGTVAFRLPKAARPAGEVRFPVPTGPALYGEVTITEDGAATVEVDGDPEDYVGLDGITFRAG